MAAHVLDRHPSRAGAAEHRVQALAVEQVVATVPSHEDDNPEHIHLYDGERLAAMFRAAGARRVAVDHVRGHIVVVALR